VGHGLAEQLDAAEADGDALLQRVEPRGGLGVFRQGETPPIPLLPLLLRRRLGS